MKLSLFSYLALALPLAAALPSGSQASCNVRGYDNGNPTAYFYSTKNKYRSNAACGARCAADSECQSYAFGDDTCLGYTSTVYVAFSLSGPMWVSMLTRGVDLPMCTLMEGVSSYSPIRPVQALLPLPQPVKARAALVVVAMHPLVPLALAPVQRQAAQEPVGVPAMIKVDHKPSTLPRRRRTEALMAARTCAPSTAAPALRLGGMNVFSTRLLSPETFSRTRAALINSMMLLVAMHQSLPQHQFSLQRPLQRPLQRLHP